MRISNSSKILRLMILSFLISSESAYIIYEKPKIRNSQIRVGINFAEKISTMGI